MSNHKCLVRLHDKQPGQGYEAVLLQFVPAAKPYERKLYSSGTSPMMSVTVDALVKLETFNKGGVYQVPINLVEIVDEWPTDK